MLHSIPRKSSSQTIFFASRIESHQNLIYSPPPHSTFSQFRALSLSLVTPVQRFTLPRSSSLFPPLSPAGPSLMTYKLCAGLAPPAPGAYSFDAYIFATPYRVMRRRKSAPGATTARGWLSRACMVCLMVTVVVVWCWDSFFYGGWRWVSDSLCG